jgi:hypothetical protein
MSPTIITNFTAAQFVPTKRNRHSVENDRQSAQIKRINRIYKSRDCDRFVRVIKGVPTLIEKSTGLIRPNFFENSLNRLESILNNVNGQG